MGGAGARRHTAPMTSVYLVDDSKLVCSRLREMLAAVPGVEVVGEDATVAAAVAGIPAKHPDIVLVDLHLADGSGFDVLRALDGKAPGTDWYMLSNFAADPYRQIAERLGVRAYFDKFKDFERVKDIVAEHARGAASHAVAQ